MTEELTWATCQPWETLTAPEKAASLIEELEATAERLTRYSSSPLDGLLQAAADVLRELTAGAAAPAEGALATLLQSWDKLAASTATSEWEEAYRQSRANAAQELRDALSAPKEKP